MKVERIQAGLEARLVVTGYGRFVSAAFLGLWLAGWATGEWFATSALVTQAHSLFTGQPAAPGQKPLELAPALAAGSFLIFWLILWTYGGVMAGCGLLRQLFGRDRILARFDGVEVEHHYGLFRSLTRLPREEIRRFYRLRECGPLCAETTGGIKVLTQLGTPAERAELEQALNAEFSLTAASAPNGALPKGWCEIVSPERDTVLIKDPVVRRKQARVLWIIEAFLLVGPLYLLFADRERPDLWRGVILFGLLASAGGFGAVWLSFGRNEWKLDKGRLILQRRFGQNRTQRFEATSLELVESSGDDSISYQLKAVAAGAPTAARSQLTDKFRRTIYSQSQDPTEPREFGRWLSRRCQVPFVDLSTTEAKATDLAALEQQLADSGRLGRVFLRVVKHFDSSSPRRDA